MSNRVHPDGKGDVTSLRAKVATVAASAIEDTPIEVFRLAESTYHSAVASQIPKFMTGVQASLLATTRSGVTAGQAGMLAAPVLNGIDVLEKNGFKELDGKKIGLVTNHTGRNLAGKPTIDVLFEAKNVKLVSLFAPEHGIRGELDTEKIGDAKDEKTGIPIYSLYDGDRRRPKPEQLKDLDAIVLTFRTSALDSIHYRDAEKRNGRGGEIGYTITCRPPEPDKRYFGGRFARNRRQALVHRRTHDPGPIRADDRRTRTDENAERKIGAKLNVIRWTAGGGRCGSTKRTNLDQPEPEYAFLTQATLYPGIGLLETTNLSVGRGTDTPFEVIGAPWLDGQKLAKHLNERNLPGVRFVPIRYRPKASVFKEEDLGGVNFIVTDRAGFNSVRTGIEIAAAIRKLYPTEWQVDRYLRLLVNQEILDRLKRGETPEAIERSWAADLVEFQKRRALYLLYQ